MGVEEIGQSGELVGGNMQFAPDHLTLYPAVVRHHHGNKTLLIHRQQIVPANGDVVLACRHRVGGVVDKGGDHLSGLCNDGVDLLHLPGEGCVDLVCLLAGHIPLFHQFIDEKAVSLGGRDASGAGVGLFQIPQFHQIGKLVANGGGADAAAHGLGDILGTHRLGGFDVSLGDHLQYLFFSGSQFHVLCSFSTLLP